MVLKFNHRVTKPSRKLVTRSDWKPYSKGIARFANSAGVAEHLSPDAEVPGTGAADWLNDSEDDCWVLETDPELKYAY